MWRIGVAITRIIESVGEGVDRSGAVWLNNLYDIHDDFTRLHGILVGPIASGGWVPRHAGSCTGIVMNTVCDEHLAAKALLHKTLIDLTKHSNVT